MSLDASDGSFVAILVSGVALIAVAAFLVRRRKPDRRKSRSTWQVEAARVCAAGREVIDLTAMHQADAPGNGLSVAQLSEIDDKLGLLIEQINGATSAAPSPEAAHQMRLAGLHASSLRDAVQTERRIRLSSPAPAVHTLDTTALQIVSERSGLDDVLRQISTTIGDVK